MFGESLVNPMTEMRNFKAAMASARAEPPWRDARLKEAAQWNPYSFEGGTAAVAGENFAVVASDTRMTQRDINILTRNAEKIDVLNDSIILTTSGFYGDVLQMKRLLEVSHFFVSKIVFKARLHKYRFDYRADMSVDLCSEMLSRNLYYKRFFPYYTGTILAGIDENGRGAVYSYDPIGCIERLPYTASGSAEPIIIPFLDCQVGHATFAPNIPRPPLTLDRAAALLRDVFRMAAEREITTGDRINLVIAEAGKPVRRMMLPLRED